MFQWWSSARTKCVWQILPPQTPQQITRLWPELSQQQQCARSWHTNMTHDNFVPDYDTDNTHDKIVSDFDTTHNKTSTKNYFSVNLTWFDPWMCFSDLMWSLKDKHTKTWCKWSSTLLRVSDAHNGNRMWFSTIVKGWFSPLKCVSCVFNCPWSEIVSSTILFCAIQCVLVFSFLICGILFLDLCTFICGSFFVHFHLDLLSWPIRSLLTDTMLSSLSACPVINENPSVCLSCDQWEPICLSVLCVLTIGLLVCPFCGMFMSSKKILNSASLETRTHGLTPLFLEVATLPILLRTLEWTLNT